MIGRTIQELRAGDVAEDSMRGYINKPPLIDTSAPVM